MVGQSLFKQSAGAVEVSTGVEKPGEVVHRARRLILGIRERGEVCGELLVDGQRLAVHLLRLLETFRVLEDNAQIAKGDRQTAPVLGHGRVRGRKLAAKRKSLSQDIFRLRAPARIVEQELTD